MTRKELKQQASTLFSYNYWPSVGAYVIVNLIIAGVSTVSASFIGPVASFFLYPLSMGMILFFLKLSDGEKPTISSIFSDAFDGKYYLRRVGGYAWMSLFTFLWSLLFIVPGIVKGFSYALTPYILAKYPEISAKEALKVSMKLMDGKKAELFVLRLSFIGWFLLSAITFGLLGIFYVFPYYTITETLWCKKLFDEATEKGDFSYTPLV